MMQGNINLTGLTFTLGTAAASPGTLSHGGASTNGWMYGGTFTRYFNTVTIADGAAAGLFPMGNSGTDYRPFFVSCPATAPTTGGTITLSHTSFTSATTVSIADDVTVVQRQDSYWTSAAGGGLAGGTYNLRGEGTGFGVIGAVADLRLTLVSSVVGSPGVNAGTTSNPEVNRTGLTLANLSNNFYIGSVDAANSPLFLSPPAASSSLVTNDGLALTLEAALTATMEGGFTNQTNVSLGTIDNAGTITTTGDWTNNSANTVFSTNTGLVEFIGSTATQTIRGTNSTEFYNLTVNNTYATSPQIYLLVDPIAKNTLTMTQGNIILAGRTLTLGTAAATPGTLSHGGTSADGWMYAGNFIRYFDAATIANGAVAGLFPMGNTGTDFRPFYVSCPSTAPTTGGTITVSHSNATSVSTVSFADDVTVVRRHNSFWTSAPGGGLAGGTYNLRAEGTEIGTIGDVADLRLTLAGGVVGSPGVNAGTTINPQVNRTGLTLANLSNDFYISSVDATSSPLTFIPPAPPARL